MSSRWVFLVPVVLIALLASASPGRLQAQGPSGWSTPVNLSESDTASYYPDVAVDSAGWVYVVWGEFSTDDTGASRPDMLMLRIWDGQAWSPANDIAVGGHLPQVGVDSQGRLHVLRVGSYISAWAQQDPLNAQNWTGGQTWYLRSPYWPDMLIDNQDRIHIVFRDTMEYDEDRTIDEGVCATGCRGIYYVRSTDGGETWSSPVQLDEPEGDAEEPRLAAGVDGAVYVVWLDTNANEGSLAVSFAWSADGGETWSTPRQLVAGDPEGYDSPQVAVDSTGVVHVAWRYHRRLPAGNVGYLFSADRGQNWSPVEVLPIVSSGPYSFGLAVDSADNLHMLLPLFGDGYSMGVYHLVRPVAGPWSAPMPVSQNPCNNGSADAELVISHGNQLHAVWYDRVECELGYVGPSGRGEVFYSTLTTDAPALPLATLPPMPTSTPALTPTQQPTPSPAPSLVVPTWQPLVSQEKQAFPSLPPLAVGIGLSMALIVLMIAGWSLRHRAL